MQAPIPSPAVSPYEEPDRHNERFDDRTRFYNRDVWEERVALAHPLPGVYYEVHWTYENDAPSPLGVLPCEHRLFAAQFASEDEMGTYTSGWCCGGIGFRTIRVERGVYSLREENGHWRGYVRNGAVLYSHTSPCAYYSHLQ